MVSVSDVVVSVKTLLISTGFVCIAVCLKLSVPLILDSATYKIPMFWSTLHSWLQPPYLYVIINGIILTIVATSKFYQNHENHSYQSPDQPKAPQPEYVDLPVPALGFESVPALVEYGVVTSPAPALDFESVPALVEYGVVTSPAKALDFESVPSLVEYGVVTSPEIVDLAPVQIPDVKAVFVNGSIIAPEEEEEEVQAPQIINPLPPTNYLFPSKEKPLISSRFSHRKPVRSSLEGGSGKAALRVAKPRKHETLENTWKAITDGRHVPLTRHLKKSDTMLETQPEAIQSETANKSFKDLTNFSKPVANPSRLRKDPSLSQDELNRRVEAFIQKFNEEMRLQREESLNQYKEMINRGAH